MKPLRALGLCLVFGAACSGADLALEVTIPGELVSETEWFEVAAYKDARCAVLDPLLADGLPDGMAARAAFLRRDRVGPRFGDIPSGRYAFAAVARDRRCAILAKGCVEEDVGGAAQVTVRLKGVESPTGQCPAGATCQAGRCTPANDNADPSVGARCSLELLGAGPLVTTDPGGGIMSAPAIAKTSSGFVVTYRANSPFDGSARAYVLPIDASGGVYDSDLRVPDPPNMPELDVCEREPESDGVGLVVSGDTGLVAIANTCTGAPSVSLVGFDIAREFLDRDQTKSRLVASAYPPITTPSPGGAPIVLGAAKAAALRTSDSLLVYASGGIGHIATMDPARGVIVSSGTFGGTSGIADTWVAASDRLLALLATGTGGLPSPAPSDAGAGDGGTVGGGDEGEGEPTDGAVLRLSLLPADTPIDAITPTSPRAPITFPGTWASLAALGGRVIVATDGHGPGRAVTFRAFDLDGQGPSAIGGFGMEGDEDTPATAGDVAINGNRAYFAALRPGAIELHVYEGASTTPAPLRHVSFGRETRISAINTLGDGRVAVAATDTRVAVAWTTKKVLAQDDPPGGYAVFACTP